MMPEDMKLHVSAFQDSAVLLTFVVAKEDTQMRNIFKNYPQNKHKQFSGTRHEHKAVFFCLMSYTFNTMLNTGRGYRQMHKALINEKANQVFPCD